MVSKKIYLIRHGQTDYNLQNIVQGSGVDSSLNGYGVRQSIAFYEAYKHVSFDKIFTSALRRSIETVQPFVSGGTSSEALAGLNEICWGRKEGKRITPEEDSYYYDVLDQWARGNTSLRVEGGESPEDVITRIKPAVDYILDGEEQTILICMHGRAMRILLCYLLKYPLHSMDYFEHENLCLYLLRETSPGFQVELFNNTRHLRGLRQSLVPAA